MFQKNDPFHATAGTPPQRKNEQNLTLITNFKSFSFMKKILLSLLALVAMAGMANAQRAWAYDLGLGYESDTYTFTFKATTAANATLIFTDAEGVELATHDAGAVVAGSNTIALTKAQLPEGTEIHWAVKMTGAAIALSGSYLTELTAAGQGLDFYLPQGVVVDNNPESETFSTLFIAEAQGGKLSVGPTHKQGIYHYSQKLAELNPTDQGIIPSNVTLTNGNRQEMHRIAINPKNNHVAFAHNISGKPAVWSVPANNPAGEATNLIAGTAITMPNSICFDENGVLYVMDNANATTGGTLYKVVDGVATKLVQNKTWQQVDNSLAYDGRGGIWIAQTSTGTTWPSYAILSHVNSSGEIDWSALDHSSDGLFSAGNEYGYSQRGQCAYNTKEDLLVLGGNCRSHIFQVTYNAAGAPSLTLKYRTPYLKASTNIDGAAFDYAGDLYLMSATRERLYKYAVPTDNNTCITPAPKAQVIVNSNAVVTYAISVTANAPAMGTVTGGGVYYPDETVRLTATPNEGHKFVNWSNGSTDNPLVFTATEDVELTANFEAFTYTITVASSDETKGTVAGGGTYAYNTTVTLTATANDGYEFAGWSNGSKANPLTINVKEDTELTANFRQVLATSITLNALPVQDYTPAIKGTIKRAVQNGENTIVLTHEADGTAHIYNIAHATQTVIEISQEGVNAAADGYLAISDIAVTDDGKLVACNYVHCTFTPSNTSYFYIWNDLAGDPTVWFTSQKSGNYNDAYMGYTMALKGTSQNAEVTISAFNKSNSNTRYSHLYVVNGEYTDDNYKYSKDNAALHPNTLGKNTYELNASPLAAGNWIVDGELASPIEFVEKNTVAIDTYTALNTDVLGKKYNGVSYLKNYNDHHFMIAPYTNEEGLLAGVKVIGITDGFAAPIVLATNTDLDVAVEATTAAATALVDAEGKLTIHLWADAKVYTFTEKTIAMYTIDAIPNNGAMGTITGSGSYLEGTQVTLTATPAEGYEFTCWTSGKDTVSTENPYKFTVTADVALVANFAKKVYTVTITAENGTIKGLAADGKYEHGAEATLTATPAEGYEFVNWTVGETVVTENPYKFTVTADIALVANFKLIPPTKYNVTVTAENGTVTGAGEYEEGKEATLTATPAEGYEFVNWTKGEEVVSTENPYKFTVTADVALVANFKKAITTITKTFDITQEEDTRNMGSTYVIYADDDYTLRIYGYNGAGTYQDDPTTEEDAAPMLFTPDYDDALNAVVVVTLDNENNKEVMQVTATSEDGSTIYNLTINITLPSYETYSLMATGIKAENGEVEGMPIISLKGEGLQNGEEKVPFDFMVFESAVGYMAEGTIGDVYVFSTMAEFFVENGEFNFMATMQDEESKYLFNVDINGTMAQPEVEIVVKEEVNVTLYNLTVDVQGTMAMVSAGTEELSFWLTLLQTENHYGDYTNDAFSNIRYGDDQLYAAYGEKHTYDVTDGKVNFVVSFITTPDAEGNVTKYNFTLYAGEKPSDPTALDNISIEGKAAKAIINGQLIIVKDGVQYNAQGAVVK